MRRCCVRVSTRNQSPPLWKKKQFKVKSEFVFSHGFYYSYCHHQVLSPIKNAVLVNETKNPSWNKHETLVVWNITWKMIQMVLQMKQKTTFVQWGWSNLRDLLIFTSKSIKFKRTYQQKLLTRLHNNTHSTTVQNKKPLDNPFFVILLIIFTFVICAYGNNLTDNWYCFNLLTTFQTNSYYRKIFEVIIPY